MPEMTGGCLCGQVRYSANTEPAFVGVCHCKNCQKQTGTAFSVLVGIPKTEMSIQGRLKTFHDKGDSGQAVDRNFCPECGSPVFTDAAVLPGVAFIKAYARRHKVAGSQTAYLLRQQRALDAYT
jgi:hypothetical protein